jgi:sulfite reductase alpha subunit-like flavoprotein
MSVPGTQAHQPSSTEQLQQQPLDPKHLGHIAIHNPRRILFLYGSQTGCAQDVAENAAREARRMHFSATVSAMDDYDRVIIRGGQHGRNKEKKRSEI